MVSGNNEMEREEWAEGFSSSLAEDDTHSCDLSAGGKDYRCKIQRDLNLNGKRNGQEQKQKQS